MSIATSSYASPRRLPIAGTQQPAKLPRWPSGAAISTAVAVSPGQVGPTRRARKTSANCRERRLRVCVPDWDPAQSLASCRQEIRDCVGNRKVFSSSAEAWIPRSLRNSARARWWPIAVRGVYVDNPGSCAWANRFCRRMGNLSVELPRSIPGGAGPG